MGSGRIRRAVDAAVAATPHAERLLRDPQLRAELRDTSEAVRRAQTGLRGNGGLAGMLARIATDPRVRGELRLAAVGARHAASRLELDPDGRWVRRWHAVVVAVGAGIGLVSNPLTGPPVRRLLVCRLLLRRDR